MIVRKSVRRRRLPPAELTRWLALSGSMLLVGCSARSAPAIVLFGAYFPDWLLFALLAIATAVIARVAFGIAGLGASVPFPLFTYLAIGILVAGVADLLWLGH